MTKKETKVLVVGAGLAGSEAANFLAKKGVSVVLVECKRVKKNPAQKSHFFAELVCTNSLKSVVPTTGHGILKHEMRALGSLVLSCAEQSAVGAGDALAVDREQFGELVTKALEAQPLIEIIHEEVGDPLALAESKGCDFTIVATGPLTTTSLEKWIAANLGGDDLYFYDAIAPVVDADSLDFDKLYFKDRHKTVGEEEGESADYLNAPMNKEQYEHFVSELVKAEKTKPKDFEEERFFEACLPVDLMAERGPETPRFSCMKPIGLEMPDGTMPYACVQLRKENLPGSAFNLVGFQTRLTYPEQNRVFRLIPGLEKASFLHLGSVHRNTYLNAKKTLNFDLSSKEFPRLYFAGQMTGVEGYTESASMGLYVAAQIWRKISGQTPTPFPPECAIGGLINYLMTANKPGPSNINIGLLPAIELTREQRKEKKSKKALRKELAAMRAREYFDSYWEKFQQETP
jgi:methylenetetrahydrofolate--tRNA-(uracil-5-)-methyltransferase